jgi:hypothetical protein
VAGWLNNGDSLKHLGDFNGDGLTDVFVTNKGWTASGQVFTFFSNGDGSYTAEQASVAGWLNNVDTIKHLGDFNGDGLTDVFVTNKGWTASGFVFTFSNEGMPAAKLDSIYESLGVTTQIAYTPLTNNEIYTKGTGSVYPEVDVQGPMYVVSKVTVDDGIGGTRDTTYRYEGLKSSYLRGSLGFKSMTATDVLTGIETRTEYSQSYPYVGQVIKSTETYNNQTASAADDVLLSELTNSYQQIQTHTGVETVSGHSGVLFPYANNVVKKSYELNTGALISTVTTEQFYDSYGNPTQIDVTTEGNNAQGISESFKTTTNNSYTNDTANWYLGRLTRTDVTNTLPDNSSQTRSSGFEYDPNTGLLTKEIIEPDTAAIRLITDYTYDAFGNKTKVTVSGGL